MRILGCVRRANTALKSVPGMAAKVQVLIGSVPPSWMLSNVSVKPLIQASPPRFHFVSDSEHQT